MHLFTRPRLLLLALALALPACVVDVGLTQSSTSDASEGPSTAATDSGSETTQGDDAPTTEGLSTTSGPTSASATGTDPGPTQATVEPTSEPTSEPSSTTDVETTGEPGDLCTNGEVDDGEACDDGNLSNEDACTNVCQPQTCGDGFLGPDEVCDDGNEVDADGCSSDCACALTTCGDGALDDGEACDDGNTAPGDGCSACCQPELLHVFVTSETFPIEFGGSFDADVRCMIAAEAAGLPGDSAKHFAWLGLDGLTIKEHIGVIPRPYALLDGTVIADSTEELFSGQLKAPIDMTELGTKLPEAMDACADPSLRVWSGIAADGSTVIGSNCSDWSSLRGEGRFGSAGASDARWTDCGEDMACEDAARLYCFEIFMY